MDFLEIANHPLMWIVAGINVFIALFQSGIFVKKSVTTGKKMGITTEQMKSAFRSSVYASLGPAFVISIGFVSLMAAVGAPMAWMRLSLIGSMSHELMGVSFAADAMNTRVGDPGFNATVFAVATWVLALGAVCWPLFTGLFTHKIAKFRGILSGGNDAVLAVTSTAASLGAFAFLVAASLVTDKITQFDAYSISCILGGIFMFLIKVFNKDRNISWLREWSLAISMFASMIVTAVFFA